MVVLKAASMPKARARAGEPPSPPPLTPSSSSFASAPWAEAETSLVLTAFWHFAPEGDDSDRSRSRETCRRCPESEEVWILTVMVLKRIRSLVQKSRAKPSNHANPYNFYLRLEVHETFVSRKARKIRFLAHPRAAFRRQRRSASGCCWMRSSSSWSWSCSSTPLCQPCISESLLILKIPMSIREIMTYLDLTCFAIAITSI